MKKRLAIVASILSIALLAPMSADGVEYGQDATGDPNAVWIYAGFSGFLYSDRIILTVAHGFDGSGESWVNTGYVYPPGVKNTPGQKKYLAQKIMMAPTYRARVGTDNTRLDDFAIVILRESMPMQNKVVVASPADIESFIREKTPVEMVGYGLQNEAQRSDPTAWSNRSPHKMKSVLVSGADLRKYYSDNAGFIRANQTILDFGVPNTEKSGSNCDGDSGSGFFVQKENVRYYIGPVGGSQAGITNCYSSIARFAPGGGMSGITPTNKFLSMIKEAEEFVANEKKLEAAREEARVAAELKAKQEADERARVEAELQAKLDAEAKVAAEVAAKAAADAALMAATKKSQDLARKQNVGKNCAKLKSTRTVSGVKFVCVKKGKKLVWAVR